MQRYNIFPNQPNYKCFIDEGRVEAGTYIYNSRNYKCLIDKDINGVQENNLQ
mgnify:CR=1 FL=1